MIYIGELMRKALSKLIDNDNSCVFYIATYDSLPTQLDKKEEAFYINRLGMDDVQAKNILIEHNLRLVVYIARKFDNNINNLEDLISIGTIGLIKAVGTYKSDKQIKLATYASKCIENEILMYLRKVNRRKGEISLDEPLNTDWDGNELLLSDIISSDEDEVSCNIERENEISDLNGAIDTLNEQEKIIINMRFGINGMKRFTQKEVAENMNISQSYISRLEKRIVNSLKKEMQKQIQ